MTVCLPFLLTLFKPDSYSDDLGVVILNEISSAVKKSFNLPQYIHTYNIFRQHQSPFMDNWRNIL
jgi:hypothetical protein